MNRVWAVRLPIDKAPAAGALRLWPDLEVIAADGVFWLAGPEMSDLLSLELRKLPGGQRYTVTTDGAVIPHGLRLPAGKLPAGDWLPIARYFIPAPQPAALCGQATSRVKLSLIRSSAEWEATVLITAWPDWAAYVIAAPQIRLKPLRFAVAADGRTLVRGSPLPPLPGRRCVESAGIAVPSGWKISPEIDPATLRDLLGIATDDLALFDEQGIWEWLAADDFVPASRAAVRATSAGQALPGL